LWCVFYSHRTDDRLRLLMSEKSNCRINQFSHIYTLDFFRSK
jgi:hypothetical protein